MLELVESRKKENEKEQKSDLKAQVAEKKNISAIREFERKQNENETVEQYHTALKQMATECKFGILEAQIVRDLFVTNLKVPG